MPGGLRRVDAGSATQSDEEARRFLAAARAIRAISDALAMPPDGVPALLGQLWEAWQAHEDYDSYYTALAGHPRLPGPFDVVAVAVFEHERGTRGEESYIISDLRDLIASIAWGQKSLGRFAGIVPIWPGCPTNPYRQLVWSSSPRGSGNAYECRMELKRLLPRRLHKWISLARTVNRRPKWFFLPLPPPGKSARDKTWWPEWYRRKTKAQLFVDQTLPEDVRRDMAVYVDPLDFWRAATGRVRSVEVQNLVTHQMSLDLMED